MSFILLTASDSFNDNISFVVQTLTLSESLKIVEVLKCAISVAKNNNNNNNNNNKNTRTLTFSFTYRK